jgi:hypothetical protein
MPTARLRCTITTPTLVIAEGAQFEGDCRMYLPTTRPRQPESHEAKNNGGRFSLSRLREAHFASGDIRTTMPFE